MLAVVEILPLVVVVPTKVIKFLLITTAKDVTQALGCCCCTYKGNQIFANHNRRPTCNKGISLLLYLQR